jgi:hypothetical protein
MTPSMFLRAIALLFVAAVARAQTIRGAVLAKREPHHHVAYEDPTIRVLRVRVPPHDTTLLHEHGPDYFWIALGAITIVNAKLGAPDAEITTKNLAIHYTVGKFAHVARNHAMRAFDNITVELLQPQKNIHNLCEPAIADQPLDCAPPSPRTLAFTGPSEHTAFATSQLRVSLMTLDPGKSMRPTTQSHGTWVIALDTANAGTALVFEGKAKWVGGTLKAPAGTTWSLANRGSASMRFLTVTRP